MSSGSNLSWCTAKESIQFLKTEDDNRIPSENIEAQVATDQMLSLSKHQKARVCCCEKPKNECEVKNAWKIPWIILIISATQVCIYSHTFMSNKQVLLAKNIRLFVQQIHFFSSPDSYIFCCLQRLRLYSNLQTTLQV